MKKRFAIIFSILLLVLFAVSFDSCYYDDESYLYGGGVCSDSTYTYTGRIKSITDQNCALSGCHIDPSPSGNISLATYTEVKANAESGNLFCTIYWSSGCQPMPKNGAQLDDCSIKALEEWKNLGYPEN